MAALASELGARVDVVSLAAGTVALPEGVLERGAPSQPVSTPWSPGPPGARRHDRRARLARGAATTARFGTPPGHEAALDAALRRDGALDDLCGTCPTTVTSSSGTEELLHAPLAVATALADRSGGRAVLLHDPLARARGRRPGYAVRSSVAFVSHDPAQDGPGVRYAHNVVRPGGWDALLLVVDGASDPAALSAADGVLAALAPCTDRLLLLTLPADTWSDPA